MVVFYSANAFRVLYYLIFCVSGPILSVEYLWSIVFSYNPFYFCGISCYFSAFIFEFIYLGHLSLFFDESG